MLVLGYVGINCVEVCFFYFEEFVFLCIGGDFEELECVFSYCNGFIVDDVFFVVKFNFFYFYYYFMILLRKWG